MKRRPARRQPKTERGSNVVENVLDTAVVLLHDSWLDNVSISQLARDAGISRASLLLQFPRGWPDIAYGLLCREFDENYWEQARVLAEESPKLTVNEKLFRLLDYILTRADKAGLLYANLRAQMFTWGDENAAMMEIQLMDVFEHMFAILEGASPQSNSTVISRATDLLFNSTLDLAAQGDISLPDLQGPSLAQRRAAVQTMINLVMNGLRHPAQE